MTALGKRSKQTLKIKKTANRASKQRNSQIEPNKAADQSGKQANKQSYTQTCQTRTKTKPNQGGKKHKSKGKHVFVVVVKYHDAW